MKSPLIFSFPLFFNSYIFQPPFSFFLLPVSLPHLQHPLINFSHSPLHYLCLWFPSYDFVSFSSTYFHGFPPDLLVFSFADFLRRGTRSTTGTTIDVTQRECGSYLRADIRGARGFSSGGETHWTLGKAKAPESSRRQPSSAPSSPGTAEIVLPPRHLPPPRLFSTPEMLSFPPSFPPSSVARGIRRISWQSPGKASPARRFRKSRLRDLHEPDRQKHVADRAIEHGIFSKGIAKKRFRNYFLFRETLERPTCET